MIMGLRLSQVKSDDKIGIFGFSAEHAALRLELEQRRDGLES